MFWAYHFPGTLGPLGYIRWVFSSGYWNGSLQQLLDPGRLRPLFGLSILDKVSLIAHYCWTFWYWESLCVCGYQIPCLHLLTLCVCGIFSTYCYMLSYALCLPPIGCHTVFVSAAKELLSNERGDSPEDLARHMGHLRLLPELVPTLSTWDALDLRWIRAPAEASIHMAGVGSQDELQGNLGVGRIYCETLQEWFLD